MAEEIKKEDTEVLEGKPYAILAYLWILCLVPLIIKKDNKFAMFHAKQGLVVFIGELALSIVGIIPILGWIIAFFGMILFSVLSLIGIVQVLMGKYWKMPVVAEIAEQIKF